ncbi:MAG: T9SS type A sorting domain-containing protein [Hyphomicrobiales bacterium]
MAKQWGDDIYNALNGSQWKVRMQGNLELSVSSNWIAELKNKRIFWDAEDPNSEFSSINKIDLSNCDLKGDMPITCFTQSWNDHKDLIPDFLNTYYSKPAVQNEDNPDLVCFNAGNRKLEIYLSHNKITSLSKDITAATTSCPTVFKIDHNELNELPDFSFTKESMSDKKYKNTGFMTCDFSQNNISEINTSFLIATTQINEEETRGAFSMSGLDLDISNNRLNFDGIIAVKELVDKLDENGGTYSKRFTYAPQKRLGETDSKVLSVGSPVDLEFSLPNTENSYLWYLNGKPTGYKGKYLHINELTPDEAGTYSCHVTNVSAPDLILESAYQNVYIQKTANNAPDKILLSSNMAIAGLPAYSQVIGTFSAEDSDGDQVYYRLREGGDNYSFRIINGNTLVNAEDLFDHYSVNSYQVVVVAYDIYGGETEEFFTIERDSEKENIYDELYKEHIGENYKEYVTIDYIKPIMNNSKPIPENYSKNFNVCSFDLQLAYTKDDSKFIKTKVNNISCSIEDGFDGDKFVLDGNNLIAVTPLNYEEKKNCNVLVKLTYENDGEQISYRKLFTVQVANAIEPPVDILISNNIAEINQKAGTVLGYISAVQEDLNPQLLTFTSLNKSFRIEGSQIILSAIFKQPTIEELSIKCENKLGHEFRKTFSIKMFDPKSNAAPEKMFLDNMTIDKDAKAGDFIANINVSDPDPEDKFTFVISDPRFRASDNKLYYVSGSIDEQINIQINVRDLAGNQLTQSFNLHKNDQNAAPIAIGLTNTYIKSTEPAGTVIADIIVNDDQLSHTFEVDNDKFKVEGKQLLTNVPLDDNNYSVKIKAIDKDGLFIDKIFEITTDKGALQETNPTIIGLNNFMLDRDWKAGAVVAKIISDGVGVFNYKVMKDYDGAYFDVTGGTLTLKEPLNKYKNTYRIIIKCGDLYSELELGVGNSDEGFVDLNISDDILYPNPVSDIVNVKIIGNAVIEITDISGNTIIFEEVTGDKSFDISGFDSGAYLVRITQNNQTKVIKLLKK